MNTYTHTIVDTTMAPSNTSGADDNSTNQFPITGYYPPTIIQIDNGSYKVSEYHIDLWNLDHAELFEQYLSTIPTETLKVWLKTIPKKQRRIKEIIKRREILERIKL